MIGRMGVGNDGRTLYAPNSRRLGRVPWGLAWRIQRVQHWIAQHWGNR